MSRVIDRKPGHRVIGASLVLARGRPVLIADTAIAEMPNAQDIAEIAIEAAGVARRLGYEPRVSVDEGLRRLAAWLSAPSERSSDSRSHSSPHGR